MYSPITLYIHYITQCDIWTALVGHGPKTCHTGLLYGLSICHSDDRPTDILRSVDHAVLCQAYPTSPPFFPK